jgi:hypothetical protein
MELDGLIRALDELGASGPTAVDGETIVALHGALHRLESVVAEASREFDAGGTWANDGARSTAGWIATRCRIREADARRLVRRSRALRELPATRAAFASGVIAPAHVDALSSKRNCRTAAIFERDEPLLVEAASTLRFSQFARVLAHWEQLADPDGSEESAERQRDRRDVFLSPSFRGMWLGQMTLDPISGSIVSGELERIEQELFEADRAEATDRLGTEPRPIDLRRTPSQRRADALVEMATRSAACPGTARRPAPLFSVLVGYETLHGRICQLADGTVVSPGSLVRWLTAADVERAVFGPDGRVEVGARSRFFTGATRRALELRDQRCAHPYCDVPADRCEADHVIEWAKGGLTVQENGRMLCSFHNRLRNRERPPPDNVG